MRGRTPNTPPGRDLQMERWPSGGRVSQVTRRYLGWVHVVLCDLFYPPPSVLLGSALCGSSSWANKHPDEDNRPENRTRTNTSWCFLSVWPAGRCLQSQFISSHLELVAYLQLVSERCNQNFCNIYTTGKRDICDQDQMSEQCQWT